MLVQSKSMIVKAMLMCPSFKSISSHVLKPDIFSLNFIRKCREELLTELKEIQKINKSSFETEAEGGKLYFIEK